MNKELPDKWVRKTVFDLINNMSVLDESTSNTIQVPCYDSRIASGTPPDNFVLITTQTNDVVKDNKCEYKWRSSILLDIVTTFNGAGNYGSRVLSDNILDKARELTNQMTLDVASGLNIVTQTEDFPNDIVTITKTENIFRKFMRIELLIN